MAVTERQKQALHELTARGTLTAEQESAVIAALDDTGAPLRIADRLAEVAAYLGGGLLLGGAALVLGVSWQDMARLARIGVLGAATAALLVAAFVVAGGLSAVRSVAPRRRRVVSTLFSLAAVAAAFTAGTSVSSHEFVVGATAGLLVAVGAYVLVTTALGYLTVAVAAIAAVVAWIGELMPSSALPGGVALFALGVIGMFLSLVDVLRPTQLALAVGAATALFGAQQLLGGNDASVAYALTAGLAAICFGTYFRVHSTVLLVAGVVATTIVVPEVVWDLTDGAVGGGLLLLVAGAVLLATSLGSTWLRRTR